MRSIGPAVTREQSPAFLRNSNGRLDFPGPTQEASWIPRRNSIRKLSVKTILLILCPLALLQLSCVVFRALLSASHSLENQSDKRIHAWWLMMILAWWVFPTQVLVLGTLGKPMSQLRGMHFLGWQFGPLGRSAKMFWVWGKWSFWVTMLIHETKLES